MAERDAASVLVVGDCMLDRYWDGRVARISPEAPVPVLHMRSESDRIGGAGNVALNVASLGGSAQLLGIVGDDAPGRAFRELIGASGIADRLVADPGCVTTVKLRLVAQKHQLLRVDFEEPLPADAAGRLATAFEQALPSSGCVVFSDYAKGALRDVASLVRRAKAAGKTVVVDPKGDDFAKYRGADVITPNQAELAQVVGPWTDEDDLARRAFALKEAHDFGTVLLTRSERGMSLFTSQDGRPHRVDLPAEAREVFDVTGAGDTVIATLALMLSEGRPLLEATRLANQAAAIVVGKFGTSTVQRHELFGRAVA